jgi:hypothetical protein
MEGHFPRARRPGAQPQGSAGPPFVSRAIDHALEPGGGKIGKIFKPGLQAMKSLSEIHVTKGIPRQWFSHFTVLIARGSFYRPLHERFERQSRLTRSRRAACRPGKLPQRGERREGHQFEAHQMRPPQRQIFEHCMSRRGVRHI